MQNKKDLFAPPTEAELSAVDMFAPPTEQELLLEPEEITGLESAIRGAAPETILESMAKQAPIPDVGSIEEELLAGKYKDTAPSPVSAVLRGAINEASYDIADELAAVAELGSTKLSDLVTGTPSKYESLIKQYQDIRNVKRKGSKELEEAFPTESLAGRLAGAGVLAALSGGASIPASLAKQATKQGVKQAAVQAAKLGAKYGAAQGVGKSEAEVLEGELGDLAGDISSEALLGGAAGGIIPTIVPAAKGAASTVKKGLEMLPGYESMKTGFELGKEGIVASAKTLGAEYKKIADDITKKIKTKLETAGVSKAQALELADQMQITMNAGADIQTAIEKASRSVGVDDNQKRQYIEFLKRTMGEDVDLAKATQQLEQKRAVAIEKASREGKQLQTTTEINKDVGDVLIDPDLQGRVVGFQDKLVKVGKDGKSTTSKLVTLKTLKDPDIPVTARDMENLTPSEMTEFLKDINQYTGNLDNKAANEVERNARQLASQINQKLNTALQSTDVAALNNEMANLFNAIKNLRMPGNVTSKNKMVFDEQVAQVQKRLMDISDQGKVDKELIFKRLAEASPDFTTAEKRIQLLDEYKKIAEKGTGAGGFGLEALLGSAQRRATTAANIAGRASKTISEVNPSKVLREAGKALTESSPQSVQNLIAKVQANPKFQSFLPALQDAANATTDTARKVMLDNLNTQPAFREMMRSMDMGIQPTSPEESEAPMQENLQSSTPSSAQDLLEKFRSISNAIIPEAAAADNPPRYTNLKEKLEPENDDNISKYTDTLSNGLNSRFLDEIQFKDELEQLQNSMSSDYINTKPFQGYQKRGRNINKYYDNVIPGVENPLLGSEGIALNVGNLIDADFTGAGNEGGHGNKNYRVMNLNTGKVTTFKGDKNIGFDAVPQDLDKDREGIQYNAPFTGKVVLSGMNQHSTGHGLVTIIKNDDPITVDGKEFDTYIAMSHNSENLLNVGDYVDKDTAVATMGGSTYINVGTKNNPSYKFIRDKRQDKKKGYDPHLDLSAFIVPKGENWDVKNKLYVNPKQLEEMYHKQEKKKNSKAMELISELRKKGTLKTPLTMPSMSLTSQDLSNMLRSYDKVKKPTPKKKKK